MWAKGLKIHRVTSWLITLFAFITIFLGYAATRRWFPDYDLFLFLHLVTGWVFPGTLLVHFALSIVYLNFKFSRIRAALKKDKVSNTIRLRLFQKITKWTIVAMASLISLSGLSYYPLGHAIFGNLLPFSIHLDFDVILSVFMILHVAIGARFYFTRKRIKHWSANLSLGLLILSLTLVVIIVDIPPGLGATDFKIGETSYTFDPNTIDSVRPDLFQNGSFSVFDILVHLNSTGQISLNSHFNDSMDTYVIDSINGDTGYWWYKIHYSGGSPETNLVRIDHYPWKPGAVIAIYHESESYIDSVYSRFEEEVARFVQNNNSIIIPVVTIEGNTFFEEFYNVTIVPFNMRNDMFKNDVITALDVIMTLGEPPLEYINYTLAWHQSFRNARYVNSYFVRSINNDATSGRCGFLHVVSGSFDWLSADERILTSPESVLWYWDCI